MAIKVMLQVQFPDIGGETRGAESWWGCFDSDSDSDSGLLVGSDSGSDSDSDSDSGSDTRYKTNDT